MKEFYDAILLDFDGTMVDSAPDIIEALNWVLAKSGYDCVNYGDYRNSAGDGAQNLIETALKQQKVEYSEAHLKLLVKDLLRHYRKIMTKNTTLYPNVIKTLEKMHICQIKLAICTNRSQFTTHQLLTHFNLDQYFRTVLCADNVVAKKPDPRHLYEAIDELGIEKVRTVMIGDTLTDVLAAKNAGIKVVATTYGYSKTPAGELGADATISNFADLPDCLCGL